jgi:NAD(P)-dependent dehydrogenase (short-subunit alcohol dehydrogenase family)
MRERGLGSDGEVRFDGRVAIVTGAGRGLGREFALSLARRGAAIVVNDIGVSADAGRYANVSVADQDLGIDASLTGVAQLVADEIRQLGGLAFANTADVGDPSAAASIVEDAMANFGRIDIVVNNAGVVITKPLEDLTPDDFATAYRVHVLGSFNVLHTAWPHFSAQRYGRVVNICSVEGGLIGSPGFEVYGGAKGGLVGMTRALAAEGESSGISVNGLLPAGQTRASSLSGKKRAANVDRGAALVAPAVAWLCHEDCDVSGQLFAATSGSMRLIFTSAAQGYQSMAPESFTIEELRDNWGQACAREPALIPSSLAQYNGFRHDTFERRGPATV